MSDNLGSRLRTAKESLSAWYDRLNGQWADAEKTLRSVNLSREVRVAFKGESQEDEDDHSSNLLRPTYSREFEHCLAFMKHENHWHICYTIGEAGDPDTYAYRPILECSLEERILGLEGLPVLLEAVVAAAEADANTLEIALGAAAESLGSFKATM